ncbi:MAG: hypothetical protein Q4D92_00720 [Slackia sp.]|nr:hypothetical protein [Slackia sp.]
MTEIRTVLKENRTNDLVEALVDVWKSSVVATHNFLSQSDIVGIEPEVRVGIAAIETLHVAYRGYDDILPVAFAGIKDDVLEMLFVDAGFRGKGYGSLLLKKHSLKTRFVESMSTKTIRKLSDFMSRKASS